MEEWRLELERVKSDLLDMINDNTKDIVHMSMDLNEIHEKIDELEAKLNEIHKRIDELERRADKILERLGVKEG